MLFLLFGRNSVCPRLCKKGICDASIHKIRYPRLPPLKKLALISKTNENLKLLNPCNGNLHNNYYIAKTVGEDSKTNPCQLNKYNSEYSKNSCGFFLIESGLHILSHYSITMAVHKCLEGCPQSLLERFSIAHQVWGLKGWSKSTQHVLTFSP